MTDTRRWTLYHGPCPHDVYETQVVGPEHAEIGVTTSAPDGW